jgi:hypothetical protein
LTPKGNKRDAMTDQYDKGGEAKRLIAELEGFQNNQDEEMDELD